VVLIRRFWPLIASIGAHAVLATALTAHAAVTKTPQSSHPVSRDIWIGETLEAAGPTAESSIREATPPVEPARVHGTGESTPREKPVVEARPAVQRTRDGDDSLAARILAYRPKSGDATPEKEPHVGGSGAAGKVGGMAGSVADAPARGFAKAFTRALPAANNGDPIWGQLPLGPVGSVRVTVTVGTDRTIEDGRVLDKPRKPPLHLARLVDRTLIFLRGGRFALTGGGAGTEILRLDVTLSERAKNDGPLALGFEAPTPGNPGRAYFQLAAGRFVEARVVIEP
jgi:hypothetical protein